jgi:ribosome-binding protein aMBF1 (putative translation factor)
MMVIFGGQSPAQEETAMTTATVGRPATNRHAASVIAANIRKARADLGWSRRRLARESELSFNSIQNWEQGKAIPTLDRAGRLAQSLGVSVQALLNE